MIKSRIKILAISLVVFSASLLWIYSLLIHSHVTQQVESNQKLNASVSARLSLLIAQTKATERQGLSHLLAQLDRFENIKAWQVLDSENQLLAEKTSATIASQISQTSLSFYLQTSDKDEKLLTLKVYLASRQISTGLQSGIFLALASVFSLLVLCLIFGLFRWVLSLEKYALYLMTDNNKEQIDPMARSNNPVSQVINQLLLRNSLLSKDKRELTDQIRKISYVDPVTELGNQLFFKAEFQVRLHNHQEDESGLMMLLSFSDEQEENLPLISDEQLLLIAERLRHFVKAIPNALTARLRDNDFAILLPNQTRETTDKLCQSLIKQLDKSIFDSTSLKDEFVTIGISAYKRGFDYYKVVAEADMALRNAQLQGGNSWFMFGEALPQNRVRGQIRWRSFLERVLDKQELQLHCQSIHFFKKGITADKEVLARIKDGSDYIAAETFLPMANNCGLASEFDRRVVTSVINQCLNPVDEDTSSHYSINLFIASLLDERFVSWLISKLSSYPELSKRLSFEISEATINQNLPALRPVINQISAMGVAWCIDHFGSPDEDLTYLELLPISRVKIDRRLSHNIGKNKPQQLLLNSLLINLHSKNIQVIAEGIEKAEDAKYIKKAGLDGALGYHFNSPVPLSKEEKLLAAV